MKLRDHKCKPFLLFLVVSVLNFSCGARKPDILSYIKENLDFKTFPNNNFELYYFNQAGNDFNSSSEYFYKGIFTKRENNEYELHPTFFNPDSIEVVSHLEKLSLSRDTHIKISTDINLDRVNDYTIHLYCDRNEISFKGLKIDTVLKNRKIDKIAVEIILPDFYANGHPSAIYRKLTTKVIAVNQAQTIDINIPITRDYFYYKNAGVANIKDMGSYFLYQNKKINKMKRIK